MTGQEWTLILGMAAVTYGIRYFLLALADRIELPKVVEASLNYIPPAVLTAITLPAVLLPQGEWAVSFDNPYLIAAAVAVLVGVRFKNLLLTISIGLVTFFGYQLLFLG